MHACPRRAFNCRDLSIIIKRLPMRLLQRLRDPYHHLECTKFFNRHLHRNKDNSDKANKNLISRHLYTIPFKCDCGRHLKGIQAEKISILACPFARYDNTTALVLFFFFCFN